MKSAHDIRQKAWKTMTTNWQTPILATLIFIAPIFILGMVGGVLNLIPVLGQLLMGILYIIYLIVIFPLSYSYFNAMCRLVRVPGTNAVTNMLGYFKTGFLRSLGGYMLVFVLELLVLLPFILLTIAGSAIISYYCPADYDVWAQLAFVVLIFVGAFVISIPLLIVQYLTGLFPYLLADHPEMSIMESIKVSCRLMKKLVWKRFVLDLTFIGWDLLYMFTCGLSMLFVSPYKAMAYAVFYEEALEESQVVVAEN